MKLTKPEQGHILRQELLKLNESATAHFFRLGEIMKQIRDDKLWETMGYQSFDAFYADPELSYARSSVYHAIHLVETFPKWQDKVHINVSKLIRIAPHVKPENEEKLLEMAESLSTSDLEAELKPTAIQRSNTLDRCNICQGFKISFTDLCHCGWTKEQIELISRAIDRIEFSEDALQDEN